MIIFLTFDKVVFDGVGHFPFFNLFLGCEIVSQELISPHLRIGVTQSIVVVSYILSVLKRFFIIKDEIAH